MSEPIYVFQLNEYDAVAAKWLDDAIEWYKATTGLPDEDIYPYDDIEALPPDYKVQGAETGEMVLLYDIVRRDWKGEPFIACSTEW